MTGIDQVRHTGKQPAVGALGLKVVFSLIVEVKIGKGLGGVFGLQDGLGGGGMEGFFNFGHAVEPPLPGRGHL